MSTPLAGTVSAANALQRVHFSHDAMIDLIVAQPMISQGEIAKTFGYTESWVSRVINSDSFQARLAIRKDEVVDPLIKQNFEERVQGLAAMSLDIITKKLEATQSMDGALKTFELTTKALGMGARDRSVNVQQNFVVALPAKATNQQEWAESARESMAAVSHQVTDVVVKG